MKRILVVENDEPLGWLLQRMLKKYEVVMTHNALDAWDWLSEGNTCDVIITDVNMPHLSGVEFLEIVKTSSLYSDIPVIMLSGLEENSKQCIALGAHTFLVKPFDPKQLLREVEQALAENEQGVVA